MTGFETVLLRVAGTAAGALAKSLLARSPGAGLTREPARPAPPWRRPAELGDPEIRRLTEALAARLGEATARLPEHECLAAVDAVGDAFAAFGSLDADTLFKADLDPTTLATTVLTHTPSAGLTDGAQSAYRDLVELCCAHAVEYMTTLPGFGARANLELVRRTGELSRAVDALKTPGSGAAYAFEERYTEYVALTYSRLQLFGITLSRSRREWPLDVAYISLAVSNEQLFPGEPEPPTTPQKAEHALAAADRVLLRGPAGSGKSTLLQWLAVNAARRSFGAALGSWNLSVPFVLRLRSFTAAAALPLPEEFLRASGVPLTAPAGWTEELMRSGRALVLIDGVDEVPQRLRQRTETWLRSLVAAYPKVRYVLTTRPSAVPEDWLSGQGFAPHSLLPMERKDIRAFIGHWHDAARAESVAGTERDAIDGFQASLLTAVEARRDLGRLATNPLMCSLLCALNQDRRMQLPRARKELYDAALDMLLVRRDTEREICDVEGVYLTRDEQTLLLQRLAYWLIRNGQAETSRSEAVEMVDEWLVAMPQVRAQASAEQVFSHLLIRSGLLREPVPGTVNFVHRTFQDFLGAKEAVESRDFGVLARNAHDDTWDDVIRMAVGHARPDERARILRGLLRRADKVKSARSRLTLLAAASLEGAPELDPTLRDEIQSRTAELLPPRSLSRAEEVAKAGELVLDLLQGPDELDEEEAAATIRAAARVGGPQALAVIGRFRHETRPLAAIQLVESWQHFDTHEYVDAVLAGAPLAGAFVRLDTMEQAAALSRLGQLKSVSLVGDFELSKHVTGRREIERLQIIRNPRLTSLDPLEALENLSMLGLHTCPEVATIDPVASLPLQELHLSQVRGGTPLRPLAALGGLKTLSIDFATDVTRVRDIPGDADLESFQLWRGARHIDLVGLGRWPGLARLTLAGDKQLSQLAQEKVQPPLDFLQLLGQAAFDPASVPHYENLRSLAFSKCTFAGSLRPLTALPNLSQLVLWNCFGRIDLAPLEAMEGLVVSVHPGTAVEGTERFPPERLKLLEY
ncbi:ATP-binding protein [Streptomyces roseochromogenus]|nr:ATP-binding protein [Streptomyces roseochromogenus]